MADFQNAIDRFAELGARVVALSVDSEEDARKTAEQLGIGYPVGYGLDARAVERAIGAYTNPDPLYLHATGVLLRPDGTVAQAVYSSGPIGRLQAADAAAYIEFLKGRG